MPSSSLPSSLHRQMFDLIESYLRHKSDMVNYEAARAICEMRSVSAQELTKPISGRYLLSRRSSSGQQDAYHCITSLATLPLVPKVFAQICSHSNAC